MSWEDALERFLEDWKHREDVVGILVCGSYITGGASKRSDIDVHIILHDDCNWRERGNQYVDGFLIEYFVNPPKQIRSYFKEDFRRRSTMSMVQFMTGRIIQDRYGIVKALIEEARIWKEKPYEALAASMVELKKYELWDALDNLLDCYEERRKDFDLVYDHSLLQLYRVYCSILGVEEVPYYQLSQYFTDPQYLKKYMKAPFPDPDFGDLFIQAMQIHGQEEKVKIYQKLTEHVFNKCGGFEIDGWKLRSDTTCSTQADS
jgi:Nucleotidyltransferase domain.